MPSVREELQSTKLNKKGLDSKPLPELRPKKLLVLRELLNFKPRLKPEELRMREELNKLVLNGKPRLRPTELLVKKESQNSKLKQRQEESKRRKEMPLPKLSFKLDLNKNVLLERKELEHSKLRPNFKELNGKRGKRHSESRLLLVLRKQELPARPALLLLRKRKPSAGLIGKQELH